MNEEYNDRIAKLENENNQMKGQILYLIERVSALERDAQNGNRRARQANTNDESPEVNNYSHYFNDVENSEVNVRTY